MTTFLDIKSQSPYLELIIGPMFSGKTSKLLQLYKQCKYCNIPVKIINHKIDNRYSKALKWRNPYQKQSTHHPDNRQTP